MIKIKNGKTLKLENISPWFSWDYSIVVQINCTDCAHLASISAVISFLGVLRVKAKT